LHPELDEHFMSTISFLDKWHDEAQATVRVWTETMNGLPINERYKFFGWIQPMFSQLERTCLHYEVLLDELSCDAQSTSHKHKQRAGLANLKSNIKSVTTTALQSKNNGNNNSNNHSQHFVNVYSQLGVHTLQSKTFSLTPINHNDIMQGHLTNLVEATNSSQYPSKLVYYYGAKNRDHRRWKRISMIKS
jgi:hypothetical protein